MTYLDGFITPLRDDKVAEYTSLAELFARKAKEQGALASFEAIGDALEHGHTTDFFRAVQAEDGENVVFSFIVWPDKATRDAGWQSIMADPEMQPDTQSMPFDGKRMVWGGYTPLVEALELAEAKQS